VTAGWVARPSGPGGGPLRAGECGDRPWRSAPVLDWRERTATRARQTRGFSFVELLFVTGVLATLSGIAVPVFSRAMDHARVRGALRYVSGRLQRTRAEAVLRGRHVALRFGPIAAGADGAGGFTFQAFADRNGNGVSSADISGGVDAALGPADTLADFPGVIFGVIPGVPSPEGEPLGSDPIRFGGARLVSFSPHGTATPGSVYITGGDGSQYVVRVYGDTGKAHVLRFDGTARRWVPL